MPLRLARMRHGAVTAIKRAGLLSIAAIWDEPGERRAYRWHGPPDLADWVHRFNQAGPQGLLDRKAPGASPKLTASQLEALAAVG